MDNIVEAKVTSELSEGRKIFPKLAIPTKSTTIIRLTAVAVFIGEISPSKLSINNINNPTTTPEPITLAIEKNSIMVTEVDPIMIVLINGNNIGRIRSKLIIVHVSMRLDIIKMREIFVS
jgi:hypothetical protein